LGFGCIATGRIAIIGAAGEGKKRQSQHGREKDAQDWPD
jgi:hypothetical protein